MGAYGAQFRCDNEHPITHANYDLGIVYMDQEDVKTSINVGLLRQIYLVYFGSLTLAVMKVS